jgi:hypothetical protein
MSYRASAIIRKGPGLGQCSAALIKGAGDNPRNLSLDQAGAGAVIVGVRKINCGGSIRDGLGAGECIICRWIDKNGRQSRLNRNGLYMGDRAPAIIRKGPGLGQSSAALIKCSGDDSRERFPRSGRRRCRHCWCTKD